MPKNAKNCPFCDLAKDRIVWSDDLTIMFRDGYPVSPGHTLIITRRHIGSFFETTSDERRAIFDALDAARDALQEEFSPDGFNVGINDGAAAGQTVPHLHVHLIPRFDGDIEDPRGGVRWIFPDKADYWSGK